VRVGGCLGEYLIAQNVVSGKWHRMVHLVRVFLCVCAWLCAWERERVSLSDVAVCQINIQSSLNVQHVLYHSGCCSLSFRLRITHKLSLQYYFRCCNTFSVAFSAGHTKNLGFHNIQESLFVSDINWKRTSWLSVVTADVNYQMVTTAT